MSGSDRWPHVRRLVESYERAGLATPADRAQVRSIEPRRTGHTTPLEKR